MKRNVKRKTNNQTDLIASNGVVIKQGDVSSVFKYRLETNNQTSVPNGEAVIELISKNNEKYSITSEVVKGYVSFTIQDILPAGEYALEIETGGFVFPSDKSATIQIVENLGEAYEEIAKLEKTTLENEIKRQISALQTQAIDLDALVKKLNLEPYNDEKIRQDIQRLTDEITVISNKDLSAYDDTEVRSILTDLSQQMTAINETIKQLENDIVLYDDTELRHKISVLETKTDKDTVYDDTSLKERLSRLENREDSDTIYDDTELKDRVLALENSSVETVTKQDTGWYDITALCKVPDGITQHANTVVLLRRVDDRVLLLLNNFQWSAPRTLMGWLPAEICSYVSPMRYKNQTMRSNQNYMVDGRNQLGVQLDWLGDNNVRCNVFTTFVTYGFSEWITDKPFPENPLGTKI